MIDALRLDLRHSVRRLRQVPGLSLTIIVTIVLVLTANITIVSVLDAASLRKVAVAAPDELVSISAADARTNQPGYFYADTVAAFRSAQRSFTAVAMYNGSSVLTVEAPGVAGIMAGLEVVSPEYFDVVKAAPRAGRFFGAEDANAAPGVVLSSRFAERLYGDAAAAVGKTIALNGVTTAIIGVLPAGFTGFYLDAGSDLYLSFTSVKAIVPTANPGIRAPYLIARLAPGVSIDDARAELSARWRGIQDATIGTVPPAVREQAATQHVELESVAHGFSGMRRQYGASLMVLMGLAAVLWAVGAVNLSGLLLSRSLTREQQFAVQRALGATRAQLIRESLIDGVLLSFTGLAVAIPIAWSLTGRAFPLLMPRALQPPGAMTPSAGVIAIAAVLTIVTGLLIGILPARRAVRASIVDVGRSSRTASAGLGWAGRGVIVTQVALALVLVSGAGLFLATLNNLYANDFTRRSKPVVWTRLAPRPGVRGLPTETEVRTLVETLASVPGADAAALSSVYPAALGLPAVVRTTTISNPGDTAAAITGMTEYITPGFFDVAGIARTRGRDFEWTDSTTGPSVAIVSESLASQLSGSTDAIGRELQIVTNGVATRVTVVGVAADAPIGRLDDPHVPVVFRPMTQSLAQAAGPNAHVRVSGDVATVRDGYVKAVNALGRNRVLALFTLDGWTGDALLQQRLLAGVSTSAASLALLLAALGIVGVLGYSVTARTREIGIRMSIGATPWSITRMVIKEGLIVAAAGVVIGGPIAFASSRLARSLLYGISPGDPRTLLGAAILFIVTSLVAAGLPAMRAALVRPLDALRQQ